MSAHGRRPTNVISKLLSYLHSLSSSIYPLSFSVFPKSFSTHLKAKKTVGSGFGSIVLFRTLQF